MTKPFEFTYRYWAKEWTTFWNLVLDPNTPEEDLDHAFKALGHLYLQVKEPEDELDKVNFVTSMRIATNRYTDRVTRISEVLGSIGPLR